MKTRKLPLKIGRNLTEETKNERQDQTGVDYTEILVVIRHVRLKRGKWENEPYY